MIKHKLVATGMLLATFTILFPGLATAHVVVSPSESLTGDYQTFTATVPNEKNIPVTGLRLVIPGGVDSVTPTVKPGWQIETKKSGENVAEINWTGGAINTGLRDEFTFSAHTPAKAGNITWKAYQSYQDGSVVSWDQKPTEDRGHESEDESKGPYSITTLATEADDSIGINTNTSNNIPLYVIAVTGLVLGALALMRTARK